MEERRLDEAEWAEELRQVMVAMRKRNYEQRMARTHRRASPWVL